MKAIRILSVLGLSFLMLNCQDTNKNKEKISTAIEQQSETMQQTNSAPTTKNLPFFKSEGNDWTFALSASGMEFSSQTEGLKSVHFPITEPILAADANIKMYRAETESATIQAEIKMKGCTNNDSISPYSVSIKIKPTGNTDFENFEGCGAYITDYRLHDIWILETLNGIKVETEDFNTERPNMEINTTENTFAGFAGCNAMRGAIFSEQSKLRFTNVITTRKMCLPTNKEQEFLKALQASTHFKIENNRLYLSNPSTETLVFKKVD
ncbi:META domain-containing protein [Formosa sp. A9]|uniref:META domain-containing protein n=1 Tax=Formosa sp. A9 TaxID=3442641 RepID=UPI003EB7EF37